MANFVLTNSIDSSQCQKKTHAHGYCRSSSPFYEYPSDGTNLSAGCGRNPRHTSKSTPTLRGHSKGRVYENETGEPIPNANVQLWSKEKWSMSALQTTYFGVGIIAEHPVDAIVVSYIGYTDIRKSLISINATNIRTTDRRFGHCHG